MSFSVLHKLVTYLISGLGLFALSLGTYLSMPARLLMWSGYLASYFVDGPIIRRPSWSFGWTVAVVGLLAIQLLRALVNGPSMALAVEFAAFLQVSRLFNRRAAPDYEQITVLAFLHLIAATVLSTEITYALVFIGFVIATPWMLAISHLRREIEGNYPVRGPEDSRGREAIRRVLASKRVVGGRFLLGTAALSVPLFAMTVTIFLTLPRVGQGFLTFNAEEGRSVTGFGNQVELGRFGLIREDPTVVLRIQAEDERYQEWLRNTSLRLRGTAFDHYDGRRWTRATSSVHTLRFDRTGYYRIQRVARAGDIDLRIVLDQLQEPVLFLPTGTVALSLEPRIVQSRPVRRVLNYDVGMDVRYTDPAGGGIIYTAHIDPKGLRGPIRPRIEDELELYLQVPERHERVAALAAQITAGKERPFDKAKALVEHLHAMNYTLDQPPVGAEEVPLDVFLFSAKRGHCEYFSSALAIMLRSLGIPARNVTGYVGGRFNPYGSYLAMRQGDAHSWVEAHFEGHGWVTLDPTPPSQRASLGPRQNLWADVQAFVDAIRMRWVTTVIGYDVSIQIDMVRRITRLIARAGDDGARDTGFHRPWRDARIAARRIGYAIAGLIVLAVLVMVVRRLLGRRGGRQRIAPGAADAVRLYRELERELMRRGAARPPERTPVEHVTHLREREFVGVEDVELVTRGYMAARYGEATLSVQELGQLRGAIRRVRNPPQA